MTTQVLNLCTVTKAEEKDYWNRCGAVFVSTGEEGQLTSIGVKHDLLRAEIAAFPDQDSSKPDVLEMKVRTDEKDGKNYWSKCGVLFIRRDEQGDIASIGVKFDLFSDVDMVAMPKKKRDEDPVTE